MDKVMGLLHPLSALSNAGFGGEGNNYVHNVQYGSQ
jgi:hypothetical protein